ncbi:MAG: MFS transporter [Clostridia bacterium]|nr:MFS transporter [Clostridia bacterium]
MFKKGANEEKTMYGINLRRIVWETVLTSIGAGFCVSTVTIFWNSIGMDQTAIGFVQMMFTIAMVLLDIPMGYIADRFNRKLLNVLGDVGVAVTFVFYAFAQNMYMAMLAECLLGLFLAMTNGVDQSFIKYNCNKVDPSGELFKKTNIKVQTAKYFMLFAATVIGGFIAKYNLRLTLALSFVPYFMGGLIAFKIKDFDLKKEAKHKNPVKDMVITVKDVVADAKTRTLMFAYVLGKELTHAQIWVFTPLMIMVGVPIEIVSMGWALNYLAQIIGSKVSEKMIHFKTSNKFAIPFALEFVWIAVLVINTNIITIWLFTLNGFVHGLLEGSMITPLQEATKDEVQTSVMSIASTGARLLYIPLVYIINYLGNLELKLALVGVIVILAPISLITYIMLKKIEKAEQVKLLDDNIGHKNNLEEVGEGK